MGFDADIDLIDADALQEFGENVNYKAAGTGAGTSIRGMFDDAYVFVDQYSEGGVQTTSPGVMVSGDDVPNVTTEGSTITRAGVTYYVRGIEPSGRLKMLRLSKDSTT